MKAPRIYDRRRHDLYAPERAPALRAVLTMPTRVVRRLMAFAHAERVGLVLSFYAATHGVVPGIRVEVEDE